MRNIVVELDPARIEEVICRNNVSGYTDYCFAIIQRMKNMDVPKGVYHMLKLIENLLEKFAEQRNLSEVQQCIMSNHGEDLDDFVNSEDPKYKKVQQIASEICHEYFGNKQQLSN